MNALLLSLVLSLLMDAQPVTRKLLLFGQAQAEYQEQLILLEQDSIGLAEREVVIVHVENAGGYKEHQVNPNQFAILLIGKDGGEKFRSVKPVEIKTIFKLIDSMPMRQAEMDRGKN